MLLYPNAKINLGLNIIKKREDGYHDISSVFYPIHQLFDILEIIPSNVFSFTCSGINVTLEDNICIKAFNILHSDFGISSVKIHLHKQIPLGAGLGGGSADGAFTLIALNEIFSLQLSHDQLLKYALKLGSDCPFFIENTPKYVSGVGDKMISVDLNLSTFDFKFIFPNIHVNTKEAYSLVLPKIPQFNLKNLINLPLDKWHTKIKNDFEDSIFLKYPNLKIMKQDLYNNGAIYASMSGSGSVLYGLFRK